MRVLFVCTGNICRSPTAEGMLRHRLRAAGLAESWSVDSAGMHAFHAGEAPDARSIRTAKARGVDLVELRARQVTRHDFDEFDLILALDEGHLRQLKRMAPQVHKAAVELFLPYGGHAQRDVPDPYYGDAADFEYVFDLIEAGVEGLLARHAGNAKSA